MSESVGKLQIVIKGGKPWGFHLQSYSENRSAVIIDQIEPGGKAEIHGGLKVGDHVIKINDVLCLSLADALQLIDSAFRTLTILVWRPSYCVQGDKDTHNNGIKQPPQKYSNLSYSARNKQNVQTLQNFKPNSVYTNQNDHNLKPIPVYINQNDHNLKSIPIYTNQNDKYASNSKSINDEDSPNLLLDSTNYGKILAQPVQDRKVPLNKMKPKESFNKNKNNFNVRYRSNEECFSPSLSQSHQSANLQYICEQYPLSELFFNHKSDVKIESIESHSKKLLKTSCPSQELKYANRRISRESPPACMELNSNKVSECMCCMYPKCHNSYKNCKMHSPPERDLAVSHRNVFDHSDNLPYMCYEPKGYEESESNSITACRLSEDSQSRNLNGLPYKNTLKIKENGFKNSDLKIFKPVAPSLEEKLFSPNYYDHRKQREKDIYQGKVSNPNQSVNVSPSYFHSNHKEQKFNHYSNRICQNFTEEVVSDISMKQTLLANTSEKKTLLHYGKNTLQKKTIVEVSNQHSSSITIKKNSSYINENRHALILQSNNDYVQYSNEASIVKIFADSSKSDGDEDEELCLIEENARNNCFVNSSLCATPNFGLPSPPCNDDTEIIPSNEPLPSPPSFSPVKEVIYENIEIKERPDEAIYANLEMLKIKCSVVNSATQTNSPLQKPFESTNSDSRQLSKGFSFVGAEIFSNIIGTSFENNFRSDYLRSFLQSQLKEPPPVQAENVQIADEKYSIERHGLSLPLTSAYFTTSEPKAKLLTRYISSLHNKDTIGGELNNKKDELISSINKKLSILRLELVALKEEIKQNDELGCSLAKKLGKLAQSNEIEKFRTHVEELEKITNLMLSLSGRLARAENALLILPSDASPEEKSILEEKYARLNQQYEEAKYLKKSIDRRNCQVCMFLRKYFSEEEFTDYDHFISMKTKLLMDYRELDEKIKLGEEQLEALKSSLNNQHINKLKDNSP